MTIESSCDFGIISPTTCVRKTVIYLQVGSHQSIHHLL